MAGKTQDQQEIVSGRRGFSIHEMQPRSHSQHLAKRHSFTKRCQIHGGPPRIIQTPFAFRLRCTLCKQLQAGIPLYQELFGCSRIWQFRGTTKFCLLSIPFRHRCEGLIVKHRCAGNGLRGGQNHRVQTGPVPMECHKSQNQHEGEEPDELNQPFQKKLHAGGIQAQNPASANPFFAPLRLCVRISPLFLAL